ncbi:GAF domain-containing protein [Tanacetum coccineum]
MVYYNTSHNGLGTIIRQKEKVIAHDSLQLTVHEKNYTTHDLEFGEIVLTLKIWEHYRYDSAIFHHLPHKLSHELLPFVDFYSGNIVSRNALTLHIPLPSVIVVVVMFAVVGSEAILRVSENRHRMRTGCLALDFSDVLCGVYVKYDIIFQEFIIIHTRLVVSLILCDVHYDVTSSDTYSVQALFGGVTDNHLRKAPIEIDGSPYVNRSLTPMCHRNLTKQWENVSSKALSICEVIKILSNKQPACSDKGPIVVETDDLDEILGDYANTGKEITRKEIIVHVGNSSTVENVVDYDMLYETEGVGPMGNFKEVEVGTDNETEEESAKSDTEENDTSVNALEDLDYDPKHDEVFDDDEHILKDVPLSMNNFHFNPDPKHDLSIAIVEVYKADLDVIDYDSFGSDLDDGIDSERRTQLRELRRIGKAKNQGLNKTTST